MKYVILDMEWDNAYFPPEKRFINQIIQIGAVKLDQNFNIIDTFEATVKSSLTKRVSGRFTKLTGITNAMMKAGISLKDAVLSYNAWLGEDTVTLTFSNSDLHSIIQNEKALLEGVRFKIDMYLDLQGYIQNELKAKGVELKSQIGLLAAAKLLKISTDEFKLHSAKDDSLICAALLKKCYNKERFEALLMDTSDPEFFDRLRFKNEYISDIESEEIDKEQLEFICKKCGNKAHRTTKFRFKHRYFIAKFICKDCGYKFFGRISFKKTYDKIIVKKQTAPLKPKKKTKEKGEKGE